MKKITSVFLTLIMICGLVAFAPVTAYAVDKGEIVFRATSGSMLTQDMVKTQLATAGVGTNDTYSATFDNSVLSIGNAAFATASSDKSLTSVVIGNNVTSIGRQAFYYNTNLKSVVMQDSVINIGEAAFIGCSGLTSVVIGNNVTAIEEAAFADCSSLTSVEIPASVTNIGNNPFSANTTNYSLMEINVSPNNIAYSSLDGVLFNKDKTSLIAYPAGKSGSYVIPDGVTSIGYDAFGCCMGLTDVIIPDSLTSIGHVAFMVSRNLTSIIIPDRVESIGSQAFEGCRSLSEIYFDGDAPIMGYNVFRGTDPGAIAYVYPSAQGFPPEGELWHGLIVKHRESPLTLTASTATARPGELVTIDISVENNPGIKSADLVLAYDSRMLKFKSAEEETGSVAASDNNGSVNLTWLAGGGNTLLTTDGKLLSVTFEIRPEALPNIIVPLRLSVRGDGVTDMFKTLDAGFVDGAVHVRGIKGDVDGDGKVTIFDAIMVQSIWLDGLIYLPVLPVGTSRPPTPAEYWAADVNGDGVVDANDLVLILLHINDPIKWPLIGGPGWPNV